MGTVATICVCVEDVSPPIGLVSAEPGGEGGVPMAPSVTSSPSDLLMGLSPVDTLMLPVALSLI